MYEKQFQPKMAWRMTILLALFMLLNFVDKIVVGLVAVPMMTELKLSPTEFGVIGGSFFWLFAIAGVVGGFIADRARTKGFIALMALSWALLQFPIAYTSSFAAIIACRFLLGIAEGPAWPVAIHALYKWFPDEKRSFPASVLGQAAGVGLILAGLIIPAVTKHWGWRANFELLGAVGLAWLLLWLPLGKEGTLEEAQDELGARRASYGTLLSDRTLLTCFFAHFASYWSLALTLTWMAVYLQKGLGYGPLESGRMFSLFIAVNLVFGLGAAWLSQRLMQKKIPSRTARGVLTAVATLIAAACYASMLLPGLSPLMRVLILGVGSGLSQTIYYTGPAIISEIVPKPQRASILAIDNSVASIAGMIAPVVTGYLVQHVAGPASAGYEFGFAVTGGFLLVASVIAWALLRPASSAERVRGATVAYVR
ncbi:MAG: MFS transporter [Rhodoblastus sp.]|nr:MFS transporter [Anaerolineae bacterium]MCB1536985.1 MFS transporter [Rhodoblastus sp.]